MSLETLRMVYFAYIPSIISYGIIFGREVNHIAIRFLKFKKGRLETSQVQDREIRVGNCSKTYKYYSYIPNICTQYQYML